MRKRRIGEGETRGTEVSEQREVGKWVKGEREERPRTDFRC
jgi:hypothetical protein